MKYFFVSDLHACAPGLLDIALQQKNFDPDTDTLVILGDIVDRGHYARQLLEYLLTVPHLIAVVGNHDWRDYQILMGKETLASFDVENSVSTTFSSFLGMPPENCGNLDLLAAYYLIADGAFNTILGHNLTNFFYYMRNTVWGIEFPDLIAVHGWVPFDTEGHLIPVADATLQNWYDACWCNTECCVDCRLFPNKRLLIGHWGAWLLNLYSKGIDMVKVADLMEKPDWKDHVDFGIFETDHYVAIDSHNWFSNQVNVYVYESDAEPLVYVPGAAMPLSAWRQKRNEQ